MTATDVVHDTSQLTTPTRSRANLASPISLTKAEAKAITAASIRHDLAEVHRITDVARARMAHKPCACTSAPSKPAAPRTGSPGRTAEAVATDALREQLSNAHRKIT